jgi:hypothetical protein
VSYTAAAKLHINGPGNYTVVEIFDDPRARNDNQYRDALREVEVDRDGNVYVINAADRNESNILWKFPLNSNDPNRLDLGKADTNPYILGPIGMHVSSNTGRLYLASSQYSTADPNNSQIYALKLSDLTLVRIITVNDIHHITDITEDPITGDLWISAFNMYDIPTGVPPVTGEPFYKPYLAQVPLDQDNVTAISLDSQQHDLALPLSIIWTQVQLCGGADFLGDGLVGIDDLCEIVSYWLESNCNRDNNWCDGVDLNKQSPVNMLDWSIFADHWMEYCN